MNLLKHMSNWIIKSKIQLDEILPVIDQFTDQDNEIDLSTNLRSTKGKNSRQWQLFNKDSDEWVSLVQALKDKCKLEWKERFDEDIKLACVGAWTVKGEEYSYHTLHSHQKGNTDVSKRISTVAYLRTPKRRWDGDGAFYFVLQEGENLLSYHIDPEPGTFIIMPSDMLHGAYPQPSGTRQTLNLDFEWRENE